MTHIYDKVVGLISMNFRAIILDVLKALFV